MGYGTTILLLLVGMSFMLQLMGYGSMGSTIMNDWLGTGSGLGNIAVFLVAIVGIVIAASVSGIISSGGIAGGFGVIYTIPALIISALLVLFIVPLQFFMEPAIPEIVRQLMGLIFGTLLVGAIISFVRGGDF